jgi:hypothetical protein
MQSVVHSKQWESIQGIDSRFTEKTTNLYAGMVVDGGNPFGNQSTRHSTWLVLIVLYNLPPWLVARQFFILLSLIIPGTTSSNFDFCIHDCLCIFSF